MRILTRNRVAVAIIGMAVIGGVGAATVTRVEAQPAPRPEQARVKGLLKERAATLKAVSDRMQQLAATNAAQPPEVFQAKTAAGYAAADAADSEAEHVAALNGILAETTAYEKVIADSIRANPAAATDARGQTDRLNALAQLKVARIDIELAIERTKGGR